VPARVVVLAILALLALPVAAPAAPGQETVVQDDNLLLYRGEDAQERTLVELAGLGVDRVRVTLLWSALAADRPGAYREGELRKVDRLVRRAGELGIGVLLNVTGPAPAFAQGTLGGKRVHPAFKPNSRLFGEFVEAMGRRFAGVRHWSIWNEPNQGAWLQPQWQRDRRGRWRTAAPRLYRSLVRAALAGLARSGHGEDTVLLGETAPLGSKLRGRTRGLAPGRFLRDLLCLSRTGRPLRAADTSLGCDFRRRGGLTGITAYGHHPYPVKLAPGVRRSDPDAFGLADRDRLARLLDQGLAAKRFPRGLPLWMTEFGYQTNPPDPFRGIAPQQHADFLAEAERLLRADPRVVATSNFLLRDDDLLTQFPASDKRRYGNFQTGLRYEDGSAKPALDAFRFPLVATGPRSVWGLVRPTGGPTSVQLEFAPRGSDAFADLGDPVPTDAAGGFAVPVAVPGPGRVRARWQPPSPPRNDPPPATITLGPPPPAPKPPDPVRSLAISLGG
jgi:hypothetical protein